ncbi:MAG: hypothetical protein AAFV53_41905 [Myxococcota bacterium]
MPLDQTPYLVLLDGLRNDDARFKARLSECREEYWQRLSALTGDDLVAVDPDVIDDVAYTMLDFFRIEMSEDHCRAFLALHPAIVEEIQTMGSSFHDTAIRDMISVALWMSFLGVSPPLNGHRLTDAQFDDLDTLLRQQIQEVMSRS